MGPVEPVLVRIDSVLSGTTPLREHEIEDLVHFVRDGLLDEGARPHEFCRLVPTAVPSGMPLLEFEGCRRAH